MKAKRRKPKGSLGQVFNFKLGCSVMSVIALNTQAHPRLELKTRNNPMELHALDTNAGKQQL
jgi:hypothetical protein